MSVRLHSVSRLGCVLQLCQQHCICFQIDPCGCSYVTGTGMQGVIDWPSILPFICSNSIWQFHVPVGNASPPQPRRIAPRFPLDIVAAAAVKRGSSVHAHLAKILMHTLTAEADSAEQRDGRLTALQGLKHLATLFEHFFHASNTGPYAILHPERCVTLCQCPCESSWTLRRACSGLCLCVSAFQACIHITKSPIDQLGVVNTTCIWQADCALCGASGACRVGHPDVADAVHACSRHFATLPLMHARSQVVQPVVRLAGQPVVVPHAPPPDRRGLCIVGWQPMPQVGQKRTDPGHQSAAPAGGTGYVPQERQPALRVAGSAQQCRLPAAGPHLAGGCTALPGGACG